MSYQSIGRRRVCRAQIAEAAEAGRLRQAAAAAAPHLHASLWQGAGHLWLPQRSRRPQVSSHGGQLPSQLRL